MPNVSFYLYINKTYIKIVTENYLLIQFKDTSFSFSMHRSLRRKHFICISMSILSITVH